MVLLDIDRSLARLSMVTFLIPRDRNSSEARFNIFSFGSMLVNWNAKLENYFGFLVFCLIIFKKMCRIPGDGYSAVNDM